MAAAAWLKSQPWKIDEAFVSPALRTRQTFEVVSEHLSYSLNALFVPEIYEATAGEILTHLRQASGETVVVIGHSPGIPRLAVALARGDMPPALLSAHGYPTAAISVLESAAAWTKWEPESASFVDFHVPRADTASSDVD